MSRRSAWASRRDGVFALAEEEPQQRRLAEWTDQGTRRRAEWEDRMARRLTEVAANISAIAAQAAAEMSEAIAAALQATRTGHHEDLVLAPPTTTASVAYEMSPSTQMSAGAYSTSTSARAPSDSKELVLPREVPNTCSTECPGSVNGSTRATAAASASATIVVSPACVVHEGDDNLISRAPSKRNTATAPLDPTSTPTMPSHLVSGIEPVMLTRCSMERPGDDTTVEAPAFPTSAWSSTLEWLGDTAAAPSTVWECVDAEDDIAPQHSNVTLKHFPMSRSFFVSERRTPATANNIQVTALLFHTEDVFPTIISPRAISTVQCVLYDVRPLPWPSFLDCHHVRDEVMPMPCSLFSCFPRGYCQKHPWPPPQMIFLMGSCSELISVEEPLSCSQCLHLRLCRLPGREKLSSILFLFTEEAQVDGNSLRYFIHCSTQWEIAWTWSYECAFLVQFDRLLNCMLALVEQWYSCCELSCCCESWTYWQSHFFLSGTRIASSTYDLLKCLKPRDELEMGSELSKQTNILALNYCSIVLHITDSSPLQRIACLWFLGSDIHPGTSLFLGTDSFWFQSTKGYMEVHHGLLLYTWSLAVMMICLAAILLQLFRDIIHLLGHCFSQLQNLLIATEKLQHGPVWEDYLSGYMLQYSTQFGSAPRVDEKYITQDSIDSVAVAYFPVGTIGNASFYDSHSCQWCIAWSLTIARSTWVIAWAFILGWVDGSFQLRQQCSLAGMSELLDIISVGINTLQIPWDPGACSSPTQRQDKPEDLNDACSNSPNAPSQVPWDPGGSSQDRLGGKPNFKKGGLSAILLGIDACTQGLGWNLGRHCWALACSERSCYKYCRKWPRTGGLDGSGGFGLDLRVLLWFIFLL